MSLAQLPDEDSTAPADLYVFACGDAHEIPPPAPRDQAIIVSRWFGIQGEGHIVGGKWGRDIACQGTYFGADTMQILVAAIDTDDSQELTGELFVNSVSYGMATFLGVGATRPPQVDGRNGKWFTDVLFRWRLRQ